MKLAWYVAGCAFEAAVKFHLAIAKFCSLLPEEYHSDLSVLHSVRWEAKMVVEKRMHYIFRMQSSGSFSLVFFFFY